MCPEKMIKNEESNPQAMGGLRQKKTSAQNGQKESFDFKQ